MSPGEAGFALLTVLLVLIGVTALASAGFVLSDADYRVSQNYRSSVESFLVANAGLYHYLGEPYDGAVSRTYSFENGRTDVRPQRLLDLADGRILYRLVAQAEYNPPEGGTATRRVRNDGFTLVEMLIALTLISLALAIGASALRGYRETTIARRAASIIAGDLAVTRSAAIKLRRNVSLVAREDSLSYIIRPEGGSALRPPRLFGTEAELSLNSLNVRLPGDSLTFNSRGILISAGERRIDVGQSSRFLSIEFNLLGRTRISEVTN